MVANPPPSNNRYFDKSMLINWGCVCWIKKAHCDTRHEESQLILYTNIVIYLISPSFQWPTVFLAYCHITGTLAYNRNIFCKNITLRCVAGYVRLIALFSPNGCRFIGHTEVLMPPLIAISCHSVVMQPPACHPPLPWIYKIQCLSVTSVPSYMHLFMYKHSLSVYFEHGQTRVFTQC